ncbi:MAG: hypothetical protein E6J90_12175 [Deltaproteobacteria bacterium]|nr:MAG: hypothetical protein E6J91_43965 [Deltaproteobacteria bacterium]TMQ22631.1 MAG: hypothetical protein E6J90_12175 [Deltaproteobacteria bacterium]
MAQRVEADVTVQRFGFLSDDAGNRFKFPRAETHQIDGSTGSTSYGAHDCVFDDLEGRLDTLRWTADAASIGGAWLRDQAGQIDMAVERLEMPRGLRLVRADRGVELVAPYVSLSEMKLTVRGPFRSSSSRPAPPRPPDPALRQSRLRFLDSLSGRIYLTVKVMLDLPVIGHRSLDQELRVPIQEGSLDYRALEDSLNWLEGAFLDIKHDGDRLALVWKVPIVGSTHELIRWALDQDASALAAFGRVPVRSLADFAVGGRPRPDDRKRQTLQSLSLDAIDIALSLLAPRSVEVGGGMIMFGGDDHPGMVDLKVAGELHDRAPGELKGAIGSIDITLKDLQLGPVKLTADRLHFDGLDQLEVSFDGFRPSHAMVVVHRVTATNLSLQIAGKSA